MNILLNKQNIQSDIFLKNQLYIMSTVASNKFPIFRLVVAPRLFVCASALLMSSCLMMGKDRPHAATNPESNLMLAGDWFEHPHRIDVLKLPHLPVESAVISDVAGMKGVKQHNYLIRFGGKFWAMWSDGPSIEDKVGPGLEDRAGQVVKYATSENGLIWSEPRLLTEYPLNADPESPYYNTQDSRGFRFIARGFWVRNDGELLALVSHDEAGGFFGRSLELLAYRWDSDTQQWERLGQVKDDTINNFPPKQIPTGEWIMSRRAHNYKQSGVSLLIGGVDAIDSWESTPVPAAPGLKAEEPYWWVLPDGNLMALFRDNSVGGYLYRAFSTDDGRSWSTPVQTNFPDARSKFHGLRLTDGRYVLVSNSHPKHRDYLTLAVSDDGMVFDRLYHLVTGSDTGVDYPMVIEQDGYLYIVHSGGVGRRKQSIEIERVRIEDLDQEMVDANYGEPEPDEADGQVLDVHVDGDWLISDKSKQRHGADYYAMRPGGYGAVTFTAELPVAGDYEVFGWWNSEGSRHDAVPYVIYHASGETVVPVNQRKNGGRWFSLGTYSFDAGAANVAVQVSKLPSWVVADSVFFKLK